jgi:hypothetical protein
MPTLTLDLLPWILFAIAVTRLGITGHRLDLARAQVRQATDRLQTTLAMVEAQAALAELDGASPRAIRSQRPAFSHSH